MSTIDHDDAELLLAAYALDALATEEERHALEAHLEGCAACRARLDEHREVAARLAPEAAPAPELWDRIAGELQPRVVPIGSRSSARRVRPARPARQWIGAAAAAIALVVGLGVGQALSRDGDASVGELAAAARDDDGTTVLTLLGADGDPAAEVVLAADGRGYLVDRNLPDLDADRTYQLWALNGVQPVSIALLGGEPEVEAFRAPGRYEQLLITEEPATGSPSPTAEPVASSSA